MEKDAAIAAMREHIRQWWNGQVSDGHVVPQPRVFFFDVDLSAVAPKNAAELPIRTIAGPLKISAQLGRALFSANNPPQWSFFSDDLPEANWEHPCRYLFVSRDFVVDRTRILTVDSTLPPDVDTNTPISELTDIFPR